MTMNWELLEKWDVLFGIAGGVILIFTAVQWVARRVARNRIARLLAWAVVGKDDEQALSAKLRLVAQYLFAASVWAVLGGVLGTALMSALIVTDLILGVTVLGIRQGMLEAALFGAVGGAVMRSIVWPSATRAVAILRQHTQKKENLNMAHQVQRKRVESEIGKTKSRGK